MENQIIGYYPIHTQFPCPAEIIYVKGKLTYKANDRFTGVRFSKRRLETLANKGEVLLEKDLKQFNNSMYAYALNNSEVIVDTLDHLVVSLVKILKERNLDEEKKASIVHYLYYIMPAPGTIN